MGAYKKYIDNLEKRKVELVTTLNNKGVAATNDESLETLVPKVANIETGSSTKQPLTAEYIKANWIPLTARVDDKIFYQSKDHLETSRMFIDVTAYSGKMIAYCSNTEYMTDFQIVYPNLNENIGDIECLTMCNGASSCCFSIGLDFDEPKYLYFSRSNIDVSNLTAGGYYAGILPIFEEDTTTNYAYLNGLYLEP